MNIRTTLLAASALALAAIAAPSARAADTIDIHVVMPLTGGGSFLGQGEQQSLQLVEKVANADGGVAGHPVRFVVHDDQSSPQVAVQLTNEIIATHPSVMLGSSIVAMCSAMAPLLQNGPVEYCFSPGVHPEKGSYSFTSSVSTLDLANALIRYFRLKGWTKVALMFSSDASGQDAERGLKSVLDLPENKRTMTVVETAHFNPQDVNVAAQIENVKAKNPQAFIAWSTGAPIATIFRAMLQAGLDVPTATTDGNMTRAQMSQYQSFLPRQLYFPAAEWVVANDPKFPMEATVAGKQKAFYAAFKEAGIQPDISSELAWDPARIVVDALRKLGPGATAAKIRDYLVGLKNYAGVNGLYDFEAQPQRGLSVTNAIVTRWSADAKTWQVVSKTTGIPLDQ